MLPILLAALAGLGILVLAIIAVYNSLIKLRIKVDEGWSGIDTQLKRRYDLIPNLVETVKGYAKHESETLENVIKARTSAMGAQNPGDQAQAENMITGALKSIFALSEKYPDLKANQNFLELQQTLSDIEDQIQLSRRYYNATVRDYNMKREVFPSNIIAGMFNFTKRDFFEAEETERENVKVDFS